MLHKGQHLDRHQIHASDAECNHSPQSEDRWEKVTAASTEQLCEASWWSLQPATEVHPLHNPVMSHREVTISCPYQIIR